ncbi:Uncharacterized protein TCM_033495 [Theobroma cacao]|uniref:Uncharacterized protein n=1 Tax=Theobroma cacao TaxID=3641 RepID=A0A061FIC8_THECC|nr:Uncharacterized protein TCM_033495 [Theobroma cacao]
MKKVRGSYKEASYAPSINDNRNETSSGILRQNLALFTKPSYALVLKGAFKKGGASNEERGDYLQCLEKHGKHALVEEKCCGTYFFESMKKPVVILGHSPTSKYLKVDNLK